MTPASLAPGVSSEGRMREAIASTSMASSGLKNSNFRGSGEATAACAWVAAETIEGQFAVSQAAEIPAAPMERKLRRSTDGLALRSVSDMGKTLSVVAYAVNPKIQKRQYGFLHTVAALATSRLLT